MTLMEEKMAAPKYQPHHWGKPNYYKLSVEDAKVEEGDTAYFKVKLDGKADHNIKVYYRTEDGSAKDGKDYKGEYGHVWIYKGQDSAKIDIKTIEDWKHEGTEHFKLKIWEHDKYVHVKDGEAKGTIKDDDKKYDHYDQPKVSVGDEYKKEGDVGYTKFEFKVSVDTEHHKGLMVKYHTEAGTANKWGKDQSDYVPESGYVYIKPGSKYGKIDIDVKGDTHKEYDEFFKVVIDDTHHYKVGDGTGYGWILNDDSGLVTPTVVATATTEETTIA
jgi:hypothetical protein